MPSAPGAVFLAVFKDEIMFDGVTLWERSSGDSYCLNSWNSAFILPRNSSASFSFGCDVVVVAGGV